MQYVFDTRNDRAVFPSNANNDDCYFIRRFPSVKDSEQKKTYYNEQLTKKMTLIDRLHAPAKKVICLRKFNSVGIFSSKNECMQCVQAKVLILVEAKH